MFFVFFFFFFLKKSVFFFSFQLSSIYIKGKYCIRGNFRYPVFDGFIYLEMSSIQFHHFWKCLLVCLYRFVCFQNIVDTTSQELILGNSWNFIFHCTLVNFWCWLNFGVYQSRDSDIVRNSWFLQHCGIGQNCSCHCT